MNKDLYVKSIAPETTEEELRKLFTVCGKVSYIHMVRDSRSGQFLGCAYIKMSSEAEARDALRSLDGARINNRLISVCEALPQRPKGSAPAAKVPAESRRGDGERPSGQRARTAPKKRH
jgi:RNA recognition motif-containing protein